MSEFGDRLTHYETKCRQHLSHVRLSHVLALGALSGGQVRSNDIAEPTGTNGQTAVEPLEHGLDRLPPRVRSAVPESLVPAAAGGAENTLLSVNFNS